MRLLIIDDERKTREIIAKQIAKMNRTEAIFQAGNGAEALEMIGNEQPDAVITDIAMPVMDGLEFIKALRERGSNIPVVIMSGYDEFSYAQAALRYNAVDYILKPVSPDMLSNIISNIEKHIMLSRINERNSKESFLNNLINGTIKTAREAYGRMELFNIPQNSSIYIIAYIHALRNSGEHIPTSSFSINEYVHEIKQDGITAFPFHHDRINAMIFLFENAIPRMALARISELVHRMNSDLMNKHGIHMFFALSQPNPSLLQLKASSMEAVTVYRSELDFLTDIRVYRNIESDTLSIFKETEDSIDTSIKAITEGGSSYRPLLSKAFSCMSDFVKTGNNDWNYPLLYLIKEAEKAISTVPGDQCGDIRAILAEAKTADSLAQGRYLIEDAAAKISTLFAKLKESSVKSMIEKIKETIKKNISNEDFTVSDAIKGISYSENYIRYIFSNSEGMSIKDYMIKIRMQKAFLLLKEGKPIKDVAEAAGYTNQRYFARYFKEYTGMTPSEWKASQK